MNEQEELLAWSAWREACAFGLIGEEERVWLQKAVGQRFRSRVKQLNVFGGTYPMPGDKSCAHLFESWCALHQRRDGKRYKEWLLNRGRRDLNTVQSGVMLLVRNVVREWVRESHPQKADISLDQPVKVASGLTLRELLPEESQHRTEEQREWIMERSTTLIQEAEGVDVAALRVRAEGRIFSHPQVKVDTGFGKTKLHATHRELLERIAEEVKNDFPGLEASESTGMVLEVLDEAGRIILSKKVAEN